MTKEELFQLTEVEGNEIEFKYQNKWYSITYWEYEINKYGFSFCEFYQKPVDVYSFDELISIKYNGVTVMEMLESLDEDAEKRGDLIY
ncbi:MAG: hypothetical protein IJR46_03590 [Neisseriaceae bacterium]|nr:hypothetical protein [Neisseriaceae bacterium]